MKRDIVIAHYPVSEPEAQPLERKLREAEVAFRLMTMHGRGMQSTTSIRAQYRKEKLMAVNRVTFPATGDWP